MATTPFTLRSRRPNPSTPCGRPERNRRPAALMSGSITSTVIVDWTKKMQRKKEPEWLHDHPEQRERWKTPGPTRASTKLMPSPSSSPRGDPPYGPPQGTSSPCECTRSAGVAAAQGRSAVGALQFDIDDETIEGCGSFGSRRTTGTLRFRRCLRRKERHVLSIVRSAVAPRIRTLMIYPRHRSSSD